MIPLLFASQEFRVIGRKALYWPSHRALIVADLHLEKASFYARQGQMLPPYDSRSTLADLTALIDQTGAGTIFCLGDNFHDDAGEDRLDAGAAEQLRGLTKRLDWHWITGNHDAALVGRHGGHVHDQWRADGLARRQERVTGDPLPDISGHYHPKIRVRARRTHISRPCFVASDGHLILPAFGALTGGLSVYDPVISAAIDGAGTAMVPAGEKLAHFAIPDQRSNTGKSDSQLALALPV